MKITAFHRSMTVLLAIILVFAMVAMPTTARGESPQGEKVIFFAADGLRQDMVENYTNQRLLPTMKKLLRSGAKADGGGLLTQAPPNTGAGPGC